MRSEAKKRRSKRRSIMKRYLVLEVSAAALMALLFSTVSVAAVSVTQGNLNGLAFGVVLGLFVLGGALALAAWVAGMVTAAGLHRWDWFVAVLLLGAPAALALGIAKSRAGGLRNRAETLPVL
jgi:hypothetical protein